ncbi:hypothetical protein [Methylibium rhizosphaerae]|uniref:hypothetical protein n=1 Tax=Methylibium rhizosphaerae TaxID=2570323 RepID=UPI00112B03C7|nr:hypothetical protein [Methylibium rhizosphaerae]
MQSNSTRSYRCYYHPRADQLAESGVLPFVQVKAASADLAMRSAHAVLGLTIDRAERIEPTPEVLAALETIRTADGQSPRRELKLPAGVRFASQG